MTKIYFSPSSQKENKYAWGGTNEQFQCEKIALQCVKYAKKCGLSARCDIGLDMYRRTENSNRWGSDIHVAIHTNASNGKVKGTRLFCFDKIDKSYDICKNVLKTLAPITPGNSDSISIATFYEIIETNMPCCYIEVAFHDNREEAKFIVQNTDKIAKAIVQGLCNYLNIKFIDDKPSLKSIDDVAKEVILGDWGNGADRKKKLTEEGYDYDLVQKRVNELLRE